MRKNADLGGKQKIFREKNQYSKGINTELSEVDV